jgi:tetratricopeptide (TPR) repeat protein
MMSSAGLAARRSGDIERARAIGHNSLNLFQEIGDQNGMAWSLWEIGETYRLEGDYEHARQWYGESLLLYQERHITWLDHRAKGDIALALGEYGEARQQYKEYLVGARDWYRFRNVSYALSGLGRVLTELGDYEEARQRLLEALKMAKDVGDRGLMLMALTGIAGLLAATGEKEQAVELTTLVLEHHAIRKETKKQATRVMEDASARLPAEVAESSQGKGQTMELGEVVSEFLSA